MNTSALQRPWEPAGLGPARSFLIALLLEGGLLVGLGLLLLLPGSRMSKTAVLQKPMQARLVTLPVKKPTPVVHRPPPPQIHITVPRPKPVPHPPLHLHIRAPEPRVHTIRIPTPKPVHPAKPKAQPQAKPVAPLRPVAKPVTTHSPPVQVAMSSQQKANIMQVYAAALHALIQNHVVVGRMVKQLQLSGTVVVSFRLYPDGGSAFDIHVRGGSSNPLLIKNALSTVKALSFPAFSKGMPQHALTFVVPIEIKTES